MMHNELPHWLFVTLEVLKGLGVVILGAIGAYIAYQQYKLAENKLKLDLFDKRYAVYEAIRKVLSSLVTLGAGNSLRGDILMREFDIGTADASFLLDQKITDYISQMRKELLDLSYISQNNARENEKIGGTPDFDCEYKLFNKLVADLVGHSKTFEKYLGIH
jgi:hypothetical protein